MGRSFEVTLLAALASSYALAAAPGVQEHIDHIHMVFCRRYWSPVSLPKRPSWKLA